MAKYAFTARASDGTAVESAMEASGLAELAAALASSGMSVRSARELGRAVPSVKGIPYFEVTAFYRQIASALDAGLPLADALDVLSTEARNPRLKSLLYSLKFLVGEGLQLSQAMDKFPNIFPEAHISVVRSGEESGRLDHALTDLADQAESLSNMNRRIASALVYPSVIGLFALLLFTGAFLGFVPKFGVLFDDLGIERYPGITKAVFFLSAKAPAAFVFLIVGLAVLFMVTTIQRRAASGRMWIDTWKLRIPAFGQIVEKAAMARFSGAMGMLLESGIDLPQAVRLASDTAGNRIVGQAFRSVAADVETGHTLSESIDRCGAMPASLAWRIGVAEETATLPDAMLRVSRMYMFQVDSLVTSVAGLLEPLLIIFIGSGIAALVMGMFLPLVSIIQSLSSGGM